MKPEDTYPQSPRRAPASPRRWAAGPWSAALFLLVFAGSGAALADSRRGERNDYGDSDRYEERRGHHRGDDRYDRRDHREDRRYDRHRRGDRHHRYDRYDRRHRDRHRYDRHRYDRHRYDRHRYDHYRHDRYRHGHGRYRHFDVPRRIAHDLLHTYRPYRHGRLYHAAHRHYHEIYRFPVYAEYGVEYYPYAYCEGSFFGRGIFRNGRAVFDVRIAF